MPVMYCHKHNCRIDTEEEVIECPACVEERKQMIFEDLEDNIPGYISKMRKR